MTEEKKDLKTTNLNIKVEAGPQEPQQILTPQPIQSTDSQIITNLSGSAVALPNNGVILAQDILVKSEAELKAMSEKEEKVRETHNLLRSMKIVTAIMLGKDKNKELAQMLQTDKSFTSKQIKELEDQGLVKREGEGRETKYVVDQFNLVKFLQTKVVLKWSTKKDTAEKRSADASPQSGSGEKKEGV